MLLIGRARGGLVFYKNYMYTAKVEMFITINQTADYMAWGFMSFMRGVDITRGHWNENR